MFGRLKKKPTPYLPPQEADKWRFYDDHGQPIEHPIGRENDKEPACCFRKRR